MWRSHHFSLLFHTQVAIIQQHSSALSIGIHFIYLFSLPVHKPYKKNNKKERNMYFECLTFKAKRRVDYFRPPGWLGHVARYTLSWSEPRTSHADPSGAPLWFQGRWMGWLTIGSSRPSSSLSHSTTLIMSRWSVQPEAARAPDEQIVGTAKSSRHRGLACRRHSLACHLLCFAPSIHPPPNMADPGLGFDRQIILFLMQQQYYICQHYQTKHLSQHSNSKKTNNQNNLKNLKWNIWSQQNFFTIIKNDTATKVRLLC